MGFVQSAPQLGNQYREDRVLCSYLRRVCRRRSGSHWSRSWTSSASTPQPRGANASRRRARNRGSFSGTPGASASTASS